MTGLRSKKQTIPLFFPHTLLFIKRKICKILYSRLCPHLCCLQEAGENKPHGEWKTNLTMQLYGKRFFCFCEQREMPCGLCSTVTWLMVWTGKAVLSNTVWIYKPFSLVFKCSSHLSVMPFLFSTLCHEQRGKRCHIFVAKIRYQYLNNIKCSVQTKRDISDESSANTHSHIYCGHLQSHFGWIFFPLWPLITFLFSFPQAEHDVWLKLLNSLRVSRFQSKQTSSYIPCLCRCVHIFLFIKNKIKT